MRAEAGIGRRRWGSAATVVALTLSSTVSCWLLGVAVARVAGERTAPWVVGRAAGIASYLLLVALVAVGLLLSYPRSGRVAWPGPRTRLRVHVALAVFTLVFTLLHIVVLATDRYAGVGLAGALLPLGSSYRPVPVTLGVLGMWAGLAAGLSAAFAGRLTGRVWWPIHKVAAVSLLAVWAHGVLAGSDTPALLAMYVVTGVGVGVLAAGRYTARTGRDRVAELLEPREVPVPERRR